MRTNDRSDARSVTLAVGLAAFQFALALGLLWAGKAWLAPAAFGKVKLAVFASTVLVPLAAVQLLGLWRASGITRFRPTPFFILSFLCCVPLLMLGLRIPDGTSIGGAVGMQAINAFGEELLFRGAIFALLASLPIGRALLINALLFGAMHLLHGVMDGDWLAAIEQAGLTAIGGAIFFAIRAETGSLWAAILLHMVLNLSVIFSNGEAARAAGTLDIAVTAERLIELALVGWFLWRRRARVVAAAQPLPA